MHIQENVPLGPKTTMRIGGCTKYYTELNSKEDTEEAYRFAREKNIPLVVLGGGSNTVFADELINALVVRVKADEVRIDSVGPHHPPPPLHLPPQGGVPGEGTNYCPWRRTIFHWFVRRIRLVLRASRSRT